MEKKNRRKWGDRADGRRIKTLPAMSGVSPFIMKTRVGSTNYFRDTVDIDRVEKYIRKKRNEGLKGFGMMHVFVAAYLRVLSQRPALNRFVSGQRIYSRNNIEVIMSIKKEMTLDSPDTIIKMEFEADETADDVYRKFTGEIEGYRDNPDSGFDDLAKLLHRIPRLFMKFTVWFLNALDYFGRIPRKLTRLSPFHGSFFLTSMGSLGVPPVFHHLYDFGNVPIFFAFGAKQKRYDMDAKGEVRERRYIEYTVVTDERICDGYYLASAVKYMKTILKDPFSLDKKPDEVLKDIP